MSQKLQQPTIILSANLSCCLQKRQSQRAQTGVRQCNHLTLLHWIINIVHAYEVPGLLSRMLKGGYSGLAWK